MDTDQMRAMVAQYEAFWRSEAPPPPETPTLPEMILDACDQVDALKAQLGTVRYVAERECRKQIVEWLRREVEYPFSGAEGIADRIAAREDEQ